MKIGIDLDSVLADLGSSLNDFHNETYGTNLALDDYKKYGLYQTWGCSEEDVVDRVYEFYESSAMSSVPVMPGAIEAIDYLSQNHELIVITSRPEIMEEATVGWLNNNFPNKFKQIVLTNQFSRENAKSKTKGEIGLELNIEAMIDDHIEYVEECHSKGITSYLFEAPWNKDETVSEGIIRLSGWSEIHKYF